ncbi:thioesterase family protein [Nocardioides sp.]|uniref:thioesterase family protein n=1 Tax=Nocardioides sp. TaxID=35761 RepID=UPI002B27B026|nr:thioesterase family protein [Nocardioides sp.]
MSLPTTAQVRTLPAAFELTVPEDAIDENGHMNISQYFKYGSWAPWLRLGQIGMDDDYIPRRGMSFFTVEHRIGYVGELRLGERFAVHVGFAGRTAKAVHSVSYVLDEEHDRLACTMEIMYVHVDMETRRSTPIPADLADAIDLETAAHTWVAETATGLTLRR